MAHSFIEAFESELEAFHAFSDDFPNRTTFLVDTYDTPRGIENAIAVITERNLQGRIGVRIDSGDLVRLSKLARERLDAAGLRSVRVIVSGSLDEFQIDELMKAGAKIDAFGVGTRMGVSADYPYLDTAYKLVEYDGRPVMKLSHDKVTEPGRKQVFRRRKSLEDLVGLFSERVPAARTPLLEHVMSSGKRLRARASIEESRHCFENDLAFLPPRAKRINRPFAVKPQSTPRLVRLSRDTKAAIAARAKKP
jgi:nicotinate phosphoribosyltransferase